MRRLIGVLAALYTFTPVFSQDSSKTALSQFNIQAFASTTVAEKKQVLGEDEDLTIYNLSEYEYTLKPQQGRAYKEYQVIKLDGLNNSDLVVGMITGTLERESRYVEVETSGQNALVREILNGNADYVFVHPYEKEYFIAPDGTFRYIDGRELVGSKKVKTYLEMGKTITASTFYFALKDKGYIKSEMNLRTFISLTLEEKVKLLNMDIYASAKQL